MIITVEEMVKICKYVNVMKCKLYPNYVHFFFFFKPIKGHTCGIILEIADKE